MCGAIFAIFFVPELKGRSLEETDELFDMNLWAWQFHNAKTIGIGARITQLEEGNVVAAVPGTDSPRPHDEKAEIEHALEV